MGEHENNPSVYGDSNIHTCTHTYRCTKIPYVLSLIQT